MSVMFYQNTTVFITNKWTVIKPFLMIYFEISSLRDHSKIVKIIFPGRHATARCMYMAKMDFGNFMSYVYPASQGTHGTEL